MLKPTSSTSLASEYQKTKTFGDVKSYFPVVLFNLPRQMDDHRYNSWDHDLEEIVDLEPSCVSCGSRANLTPCGSCQLVFTCKSHGGCESFTKHDRLCELKGLAERNVEFWRMQYRTVLGVDPHKYLNTPGDILERNALLDHHDSHCQRPECLQYLSNPHWDPICAHFQRIWGKEYRPTWCPGKLFSRVYDIAAAKLLVVLGTLSSVTLSGPALKLTLNHSLYMLRQGMDMDSAMCNPLRFFLVALKFDGFDEIEDYCYNYMQSGKINHQASGYNSDSVTRGILDSAGVKIARSIYNDDPATRLKVFRYLNSPPSKALPNYGIIAHFPDHEPNDQDRHSHFLSNWELNPWERVTLFTLTLRAMADLRAIEQVPMALSHVLPTELITQVQSQISINPLVLRDQPLQEAIYLGRHVGPFLGQLEELAGFLFDELEKNHFEFLSMREALDDIGVTLHDLRRSFWTIDRDVDNTLPWTPLFIPWLRLLKGRRKQWDLALGQELSTISGAYDFLQRQCLKVYPMTMSKILDGHVGNPRELFLLATSEREHYFFDHFDSTDRPSLEFVVAEAYFPRKKRRASDTSMHMATIGAALTDKHRRSTDDDLFPRYGDSSLSYLEPSIQISIRRDTALENPHYIDATPDVPWDSVVWLFHRTHKKRSMSFDSDEAAARVTQLERCDPADKNDYHHIPWCFDSDNSF